jgi:hypothetical protein
MISPTVELIKKIRQDKAFVRFIVEYRDAYGAWTWQEITEQLYRINGQTMYEGISLRGPHHNMQLLNDMIADL